MIFILWIPPCFANSFFFSSLMSFFLKWSISIQYLKGSWIWDLATKHFLKTPHLSQQSQLNEMLTSDMSQESTKNPVPFGKNSFAKLHL